MGPGREKANHDRSMEHFHKADGESTRLVKVCLLTGCGKARAMGGFAFCTSFPILDFSRLLLLILTLCGLCVL